MCCDVIVLVTLQRTYYNFKTVLFLCPFDCGDSVLSLFCHCTLIKFTALEWVRKLPEASAKLCVIANDAFFYFSPVKYLSYIRSL